MEKTTASSRANTHLPEFSVPGRQANAWDKSWKKERTMRLSIRQLLGNITQGAFYGVAALATDIIIDRASGKKFGSGKNDIQFNPKKGSKVLLGFIAAGGVISYISDGQIANVELMESDRLARRTAQAKALKHAHGDKPPKEISDDRRSPKWWQVLWPTQERDASPDDKAYDIPWMKNFHFNRAKCSWYELVSRSAFFGIIAKACTMLLNKAQGNEVKYHPRNTPLAMGALASAGLGFAVLAQQSWTKQEMLKDNRRARRLTLEKTGSLSANGGEEKDTGAPKMATETNQPAPTVSEPEPETASAEKQKQDAIKASDVKWGRLHTVLLSFQKICESISAPLYLGLITAGLTNYMKNLTNSSSEDKAAAEAKKNNVEKLHGIPKPYLQIGGLVGVGVVFNILSSYLNTKINMMQNDRLAGRVVAGVTDDEMPAPATKPNASSKERADSEKKEELTAPQTNTSSKKWEEKTHDDRLVDAGPSRGI